MARPAIVAAIRRTAAIRTRRCGQSASDIVARRARTRDRFQRRFGGIKSSTFRLLHTQGRGRRHHASRSRCHGKRARPRQTSSVTSVRLRLVRGRHRSCRRWSRARRAPRLAPQETGVRRPRCRTLRGRRQELPHVRESVDVGYCTGAACGANGVERAVRAPIHPLLCALAVFACACVCGCVCIEIRHTRESGVCVCVSPNCSSVCVCTCSLRRNGALGFAKLPRQPR